jgi:hypothetical protein
VSPAVSICGLVVGILCLTITTELLADAGTVVSRRERLTDVAIGMSIIALCVLIGALVLVVNLRGLP